MKKHVILPPRCAFAAPVFAQNSVTLYGVIDEGFNYTNNVNVNGVGKRITSWRAAMRRAAAGA